MSDLFFGIDRPGEFDRLHRQVAGVFAAFPRACARCASFLSVNRRSSDDCAEIVASVPGLRLAAIDVPIDKGAVDQRRTQAPEPEAEHETTHYTRPATQRGLSRRRRFAGALPRVTAPRCMAARPLYGLK
ncbi:Hsp20/alpha crystallin family protein [Paraburkholderia sp. BR10954]|uniref:Hsp20/alpha crystallin family protein n=1 Tax=Paraburkholderia sp. BR10954 TaxID=3236995 RepID=UPI0034D23C1E